MHAGGAVFSLRTQEAGEPEVTLRKEISQKKSKKTPHLTS